MVENASIQQVRDAQPGLAGLTFLDAPREADWERLDGLRALLPHARVTVFRHDPLKGVVSVTDPNGRETRHDYDGYARLTQTSYLKGGLKEGLCPADADKLPERRAEGGAPRQAGVPLGN